MVHLTKDPGYAQMARKWRELEMKQIRKEDRDRWRAYNRQEDREPLDGYDIASWIVGVTASLFVLGVIAAQVWMHWGTK